MRWLVASTLSILIGAFVYGQDSEPVVRVTWRGIKTDISMGPVCQSQLVETFNFVGEESPREDTVWLSRNVTWDFERSCADEIIVMADDDNDVTTPPRRVHRPWTATCKNQGEVDLNTWDGQLSQGVCQENPRLGYVTTHGLPTRWAGPKPESDMRDGCSYNSRRRQIIDHRGNVNVVTESITVSRDQSAAVLEVDREAYEKFVPEPGETLTFTALSSRPAVFRFELDPAGTSRFPGYATNANIDELFFAKYDLSHLEGEYANDGPDVIFDRQQFNEREWSRIEASMVETREPRTGASVTVTAMDYGAVGSLRAYVKSEDCGGSWQPVALRLDGQSHERISIPLDEDDNLMADALDDYQFLESGADDDDEPSGNGMAGDGLTAFEEYRGFLTRGAGCGSEETEAIYESLQLQNQSQVMGWSDEHVRTSPTRKDLFVHTPDPELALLVPMFALATDLDVHLICEQHYVDNESRLVNFTLQQARLRTWQGWTLTHEEPQHGLYLEPVDFLGLRGVAIPIAEGYMGPPKFTRVVQVTKPRPGSSSAAHRARLELPDLVHTVVHELGHAVGIPHHGDRVDPSTWRLIFGQQNIVTWLSLQQHAGGPPDWTLPNSLPDMPDARYEDIDGRQYLNSLLVEPGGGCLEGAPDAVFYKNNLFAGCRASSIARRGQQNSGDFECPMRYSGSHYYEAPGTTAQFRGTGLVQSLVFGRLESGTLVDAWGGTLLKYRNDLDRDGHGRFCTRINGTGINELPGDQNHAGDAGRDKPCADFVIVNDLAAPGAAGAQ